MKKWVIGGAVVLLVIVGIGIGRMNTLSDLRTSYLKKRGLTKEGQARGRALLSSAIKKLGGLKQWKSFRQKTLRVEMQDLWPDWFSQKVVMPQEFNGQKMQFTFQPSRENSRLKFVEGRWKGRAWGIQNWVTYRADSRGKLHWKQDNTLKFWLPTYQYFVLMPFYLTEAALQVYAGPKTLGGRKYERVLVTWKKLEAQKTIDQYLLWIDAETKRIVYVQYTVRDMFPNLKSQAWLSDYRKVGGLLLPHRYTVINKIGKHRDVLHTMLWNKIHLLASPSPSLLLPDPARTARK